MDCITRTSCFTLPLSSSCSERPLREVTRFFLRVQNRTSPSLGHCRDYELQLKCCGRIPPRCGKFECALDESTETETGRIFTIYYAVAKAHRRVTVRFDRAAIRDMVRGRTISGCAKLPYRTYVMANFEVFSRTEASFIFIALCNSVTTIPRDMTIPPPSLPPSQFSCPRPSVIPSGLWLASTKIKQRCKLFSGSQIHFQCKGRRWPGARRANWTVEANFQVKWRSCIVGELPSFSPSLSLNSFQPPKLF